MVKWGNTRVSSICALAAVAVCFLFLQTQQKAARDAEERYRKELEAHAGAITALRQAEDTQDVSTTTMIIPL